MCSLSLHGCHIMSNETTYKVFQRQADEFKKVITLMACQKNPISCIQISCKTRFLRYVSPLMKIAT